jgi:hypothetical protein
LIIKAQFFPDIGGRNVLQGLRYLKAARFAKFAFIVYLHDIVYKEKRLHK